MIERAIMYNQAFVDTIMSKVSYALQENTKNIERSIIKKYRKDIWVNFVKALKDYEMLQDGDRVCVCVSGGKDSMLLAKCFQELKKHGKTNFELKFMLMDPGYDEANLNVVMKNAYSLGMQLHHLKSNIFEIVQKVKEGPCYLCARMRRGHLYNGAKSLGCNKIALGHHNDDVIETIMLNLCYGAEVKSMMPKIRSKNFDDMELIRPFYYVKEESIISWKNYNNLTFINCACPLNDTCDIQESDTPKIGKRREMKNLLSTINKINPSIKQNIFKSLQNVNLDTITSYRTKGKRKNFLETY